MKPDPAEVKRLEGLLSAIDTQLTALNREAVPLRNRLSELYALEYICSAHPAAVVAIGSKARKVTVHKRSAAKMNQAYRLRMMK